MNGDVISAQFQQQQQQQPSSKREDQLLASLHNVLEANNYQWDSKAPLKPGRAVPSTTHTLKELLVSRFVEIEATGSTNVTALFTLTTEPREEMESFDKLVKFCSECSSAHRTEVAQVIYPVFVHVYIHFFTHGYEDQAKVLSDRFIRSFDSTQRSEFSDILGHTSRDKLLSSPLVNKFMNKKYCIRMSDNGFQLLMQFLQVLHTPFLLTLIQRYLAIEVYGNTPTMDNFKQEHKKTITFRKSRTARMDENKLIVRTKMLTRPSSAGFVLASNSDPSSSVPPKITSNARLAKINEFKEKLACSEAVEATPPSIAVYCIHSVDNSVHCASVNSTTMQYACGFADSSVHVWSQSPSTSHMTRMQPIGLPDCNHSVLIGHSGPVYSTCFNSSGEFLLSCSEDNSVRLWDLNKGACAVSYLGHTYPVWDVTFSPVGIHFASTSMDQTARLWTTDLIYPLRIFAGHTSSVNVVRFHPNGSYIATGSHDRTCRLWDIQSGQCVRLMAGNKCAVTSISFSPNGRHLVSGGTDGVMKVWDLGSGDVIKEYPPPIPSTSSLPVSSLTFSADGALLASSSCLNYIQVYNTRTFTSTPHDSNELSDVSLSVNAIPRTCSILQLHFTHRNLLIAIGKLETPTRSQSSHPPTSPSPNLIM